MYKKLLYIGVLALGLSTAVLADEFGGSEYSSGLGPDYNPGFYFGGQAGISNLHYSGSSYTLPNSGYDNSYKFAARGYVGYGFNQFISAELGYDYFGRPKFKNVDGNTQDILQHGLDLVAKATLPLDYGFGFYAKGGFAWVFRSALNGNSGTFASKDSNNTITPLGGIGVNYWFSPNMAIDLAWTKTMTVSDLPTMDIFTLGFVYKINI